MPSAAWLARHAPMSASDFPKSDRLSEGFRRRLDSVADAVNEFEAEGRVDPGIFAVAREVALDTAEASVGAVLEREGFGYLWEEFARQMLADTVGRVRYRFEQPGWSQPAPEGETTAELADRLSHGDWQSAVSEEMLSIHRRAEEAVSSLKRAAASRDMGFIPAAASCMRLADALPGAVAALDDVERGCPSRGPIAAAVERLREVAIGVAQSVSEGRGFKLNDRIDNALDGLRAAIDETVVRTVFERVGIPAATASLESSVGFGGFARSRGITFVRTPDLEAGLPVRTVAETIALAAYEATCWGGSAHERAAARIDAKAPGLGGCVHVRKAAAAVMEAIVRAVNGPDVHGIVRTAETGAVAGHLADAARGLSSLRSEAESLRMSVRRGFAAVDGSSPPPDFLAAATAAPSPRRGMPKLSVVREGGGGPKL
ncbi:hypothetical protein [Azospirillum sp. TSO5]|uniref:hypothetical protein n=1 Tax=Azospirillum sp. TSO5 TaxID=716760 RepID=UPI000D61A554|nr:hypothetical protein [Azospirillum sp. TSO5]PWC92876.1 hypothetical protein TSO5_15710 [Azospirillum sp. TSO5]